VHDIDRTQLETAAGYESGAFGAASYEEFGEGELLESPFSESELTELAAELLSVSSEQELDHFLGKLISGAWRGIKKIGSVVGKVVKPFGGILKAVAKKALPFLGSAVGSLIPIPGVGTALGGAVGTMVSKALETEYEGTSGEDREFEVAKRFVRLAGTAARQVALAKPGMDPQFAAITALNVAARRLASGLQVPQTAATMFDQTTGTCTTCGGTMTDGGAPNIIGPSPLSLAVAGPARSGRWMRRGRKIVLLGA
jgi:hypothetical protein